MSVKILIKPSKYVDNSKVLHLSVNGENVVHSYIRPDLAKEVEAFIVRTNTPDKQLLGKLQHMRNLIISKDKSLGILEARIDDLEMQLADFLP